MESLSGPFKTLTLKGFDNVSIMRIGLSDSLTQRLFL